MPRYDDRRETTRLYVGHLSSRTRSRDLESIFSRYGRVRDVDMKHDFAFVEFSDHRDADDARYHLDGRDVDGSRIIVEFARGTPRGPGGSREFLGKGPPPGSGRCFNCGLDGHWARDCKAGDWKNKCYRCGERGHIERSCKNSPKDVRYSRSPSPRRGRDDSRSRGRRRSYSRSRTPPKRERSLEREGRRSRSPRDSRSPKRLRGSPPPSKGRNRSLSPYERSPRKSLSGSPREKVRADGSDYSGSPRARSVSPKNGSPVEEKEASRSRSRSPAPLDDRSRSRSRSPPHRDDRSRSPDDGNYNNGSPAGSESP